MKSCRRVQNPQVAEGSSQFCYIYFQRLSQIDAQSKYLRVPAGRWGESGKRGSNAKRTCCSTEGSFLQKLLSQDLICWSTNVSPGGKSFTLSYVVGRKSNGDFVRTTVQRYKIAKTVRTPSRDSRGLPLATVTLSKSPFTLAYHLQLPRKKRTKETEKASGLEF